MAERPRHNEFPENSLVGDEEVYGVDPSPEYNEYKSEDEAQGGGKLLVHEVAVNIDKVVLDPDSPEAVQVPDAGRGSTDLPIHQLNQGSPEDRFRAESESDDRSEEETPAASDKEDSE